MYSEIHNSEFPSKKRMQSDQSARYILIVGIASAYLEFPDFAYSLNLQAAHF